MYLFKLCNNGNEIEYSCEEVEVSDIDTYSNMGIVNSHVYKIDEPTVGGIREVSLLTESRLSKDVAVGKMLKAVLDYIDNSLHGLSEAQYSWKTLETMEV